MHTQPLILTQPTKYNRSNELQAKKSQARTRHKSDRFTLDYIALNEAWCVLLRFRLLTGSEISNTEEITATKVVGGITQTHVCLYCSLSTTLTFVSPRF